MKDLEPDPLFVSPRFADVAAALNASDDPATAARMLILRLQDYVRVTELLAPDQMHKHLQELVVSEDVWAGVLDAADTYRQTVEELVRNYVENRCDEDAYEAYESNDFEEAIGDVIQSFFEQCCDGDHFTTC